MTGVGSVARKLILERDNHTCQNCGERRPDSELVVHHLRYPVRTLKDLMLMCRRCHPVGRKVNLGKKERRLRELVEILSNRPTGIVTLGKRYNEKYKTKLTPKMIKINLLELYAYSHEGLIEVNSQLKFLPTDAGYIFWKEKVKK